MPKRKDFVNIPCYVLKSGNQTIYPTINFDDPDTHSVCIYGFSDKPIYDKFIKSADQALTPYPLVKGYLSNQVDEAASIKDGGDCRRLVILDAIDQAQPVLSAATMATVLLAYQEKAKQVRIEFELVFDPETTGYRLRDDSNDVPAIAPSQIVN